MKVLHRAASMIGDNRAKNKHFFALKMRFEQKYRHILEE